MAIDSAEVTLIKNTVHAAIRESVTSGGLFQLFSSLADAVKKDNGLILDRIHAESEFLLSRISDLEDRLAELAKVSDLQIVRDDLRDELSPIISDLREVSDRLDGGLLEMENMLSGSAPGENG